MKPWLFFFLAIAPVLSSAQAADSLKTEESFPPETQYIDPQFLLGIWESADSSKWKIKFLYHMHEFVLATDSALSGEHQFSRYVFFKDDSLGAVSTGGVMIQWPPDGCYVKKLDENNIEIQYANIERITAVVNYRRVTVKK